MKLPNENYSTILKNGEWIGVKMIVQNGVLGLKYSKKYGFRPCQSVKSLKMSRPENIKVTLKGLKRGSLRIKDGKYIETVDYSYVNPQVQAESDQAWKEIEDRQQATKRQTWVLYKFIGMDLRSAGLNKEQASRLIRGCIKAVA